MDPVETSGVCVHTVNTEPSEPAGDLGEWTASTADTRQDLSPLLIASLLVLSAYMLSFSFLGTQVFFTYLISSLPFHLFF